MVQFFGRYPQVCAGSTADQPQPRLDEDPQPRERSAQGHRHRRQPIEIAAVVVWKVEDTARAVFEVVEPDEERKAAMVSNLLVVLCGDRATRHIVNAGSLYH